MRRHPRHNTPLRLAAGLVFQVFSWQISRLLDRGHFNPDKIDVNAFQLALPRLPAAFDGFRLAHLSDFHMGTWMNLERLQGIVEMTLALQPDMLALTGDFVSYTIDQPLDDLVKGLAALRAPDGVFAVLGNHDCWTDPTRVESALAAGGIRVLNNRVARLRREKDMLQIAGVGSVYAGLEDLDAVRAELDSAHPAILLAHEPDFADEAAAAGLFDLQLSGHSHGGQLNLPVIGPPFFPHLAKKYPRGHYLVNGMQLYTTRGLGTTALQLRIRCRPEIALITLRSG